MKKFFCFMLMAVLVLSFSACSSGDDSNDRQSGSSLTMGKDNFTDPAVTGGVEGTGMTCAKVLGYANHFTPDVLLDIAQYGFVGVEYGLSESSLTKRASYKVSDGRTLHITIRNLKPNTKYYYRTVIEAGDGYSVVRQTGSQVGSFTTRSVSYSGDITTGGVSSVSFDEVWLQYGSVDESLLADETYYMGIAYSVGQDKISEGLNDKYKRAPFEYEWSDKASYDGVNFYRYTPPAYYDYLRVNELSNGTTVYYATRRRKKASTS